MKSNRVRFFFLNLALLFQVILKFETTIIQLLSLNETRGHQYQLIWWSEYTRMMTFSLYARIQQKFISPSKVKDLKNNRNEVVY